MATKTLTIVAFIAAIAFAGTASLTVMAMGDGYEGPGADLIHRVHAIGANLHGSGHHHGQRSLLAEELELTADQRRRLDGVFESIEALHREGPEAMSSLHERMLTQLSQDRVDSQELRRMIDEQVEQRRVLAYAVTDELIGFVEELDANQRRTLLEHLEGRDHGN